MKNEKNITERVSTVNRMLTPPLGLSISSTFEQGRGGQVDRDGGLIWEEELNKFSQDDGIIFPRKLECKVNKLFMGSWRSLKAENQKQIWTSTGVPSSHYEGRI